MTYNKVVPFSLKGTPSLIEKVFPAQRVSVESYKEQMANLGKTLTALGSYWKGRKPLILAKACVLGCLLPSTGDDKKDLEIFEKLMGMDPESLVIRLGHIKPVDIIKRVHLTDLYQYFNVTPEHVLPKNTPVDPKDYADKNGLVPRVQWKPEISMYDKLHLESLALPAESYRKLVETAERTEACSDVHEHIWHDVNSHLGTDASSFSQLVEQLGIMRFGHRPQVGDCFCGSGQIPFEAARLGCDVSASDLNPVACMLTWGAFNVVGGAGEAWKTIRHLQNTLVSRVQSKIDDLGVDTNNLGWRAKSYLYCVEARCPQTGWMVPLLPTRLISTSENVITRLVPDAKNKRYRIDVVYTNDPKELEEARLGTVRTDGRGGEPYLIHAIDGVDYKTKISTLRGDFRKPDGTTANNLRLWTSSDFVPSPDDIFQERLYAIYWICEKRDRLEIRRFTAVTDEDLEKESMMQEYVASHLQEWQERGWIPDMKIEPGYNTRQPIWERGWTHWHHLFNARQLLYFGLVKQEIEALGQPAALYLFFAKGLDWNSRLGPWNLTWNKPEHTFYNQALNTLFMYGARSFAFFAETLKAETKSFPLSVRSSIVSTPADRLGYHADIFITDPPYGDAVNYDEILEYFISWLRKNPPPEFANWVWDSRRSLAIKGQDEDFRKSMVAAYKRMTEMMPDNGIQIIMFTHQSGAIWADMANIVWASGLQVTAAWYVATEVDSALKGGQYVKGTVLLVCRKRLGAEQTTRDDVAWEIRDEVRNQVATMTGLNQETKGLHRDENLFEDADLQMAGYAAALRVLTKYSTIDGKNMAVESMRPRTKGQKTFVDDLIDFAVDVANQCLVPQGIRETTWDKLKPAERFYLKMAQMEARGIHTLDNYQNFAKAFKVKDFGPLMASSKANNARLKSAVELGKSEMSRESQLGDTKVRAVLYAVYEVVKNVDIDEVIGHLSNLMPDYFNSRNVVVELADYLALCFDKTHPEEARAARVLRERVKNQSM